MSNPFNKLIEAIREEGRFYNEPSFFIAKVSSPIPNLKVKLNNMELDKNNLMIDKSLLDRHNISIQCSNGSVTHNLNDTLNLGDTVVMIRDSDRFIIISKVVSI